MGRTLNDVIAALPEKRRQRVEVRFQELKGEVESLGDLRRITGKAQADIAATLKIKQPSVSKIEKQADMYLSTLRNYVEAIGGELDLVVRLPSRPPMRIERLGDMVTVGTGQSKAGKSARSRKVRGRASSARAE